MCALCLIVRDLLDFAGLMAISRLYNERVYRLHQY